MKRFCLQVIRTDIDHTVVMVTAFLYVLLHIFRILKRVCDKHLQTGNKKMRTAFQKKSSNETDQTDKTEMICHVIRGLKLKLKEEKDYQSSIINILTPIR